MELQGGMILYDIFSKHLNISEIYLFGQGYVVQNNNDLSMCSAVTSESV